jgi:hypothetical protein
MATQEMESAEPFAPTPAAEWVDPHPAQEVTLPSGNRARIKKPNLYILGRTGQVPAKVVKAQERRAAKQPEKEMTVAEISERTEDVELFVDWVLTRCFLEPRLAAGSENGHLSVAMLTADDKAFVIATLEIEV